jgi:hypothetical protein
MELPKPKVYFRASLSNGEIITEGEGDFQWLENEKSPFQRLIVYTVQNNLEITSLSLFTKSGHNWTLPPMGKKAKFMGYRNRSEKDLPIDYEVKRTLARDMKGENDNGNTTITSMKVVKFYTVAEAIYGDKVLQLWVDENHPDNSWIILKHDK